MKVYLVRDKSGINAKGDYNLSTKSLTVLKGSILSRDISQSKSFRSSSNVEKNRNGVVDRNVLQQDMKFKSASTAANFVTGTSTNGLITWKDKNGRSIKEIINGVQS